MNGVAKQFWSEVLDLHTPVTDDDRGRKTVRRSKKSARRVLTTQTRRRPAA